ncbi:hypothetical protein JW887_06390 [Candidatus Dojkabacteria bacterium]|nr:hypothetical protein [Candidatus Dojkabacteria bacterium]
MSESSLYQNLPREMTGSYCSIESKDQYDNARYHFLRATIVYPPGHENDELYLPYVKDVIQDPLDAKPGDAFVRPSFPGYFTKTGIDGSERPFTPPRAILIKNPDNEGYLYFKGIGDQEHPYLPPLVTHSDNTKGHRLLFAAEDSEALAYFARPSKNSPTICELFQKKDLIVARMEETVIPTKTGGKVVDIKLAYSEPWEVHDEIRLDQIKQIREEVRIRFGKVELSDQEAINLYFDKIGFYQIVEYANLPFRGDVYTLLRDPIVACAISGNRFTQEEAIVYQRDFVKWVFSELCTHIGINPQEALRKDFPTNTSKVEPKEGIVSKAFDPRQPLRQQELELIKGKIGLDELYQIDGVALLNNLWSSLSGDTFQTRIEFLKSEIDKLAQILTNVTKYAVFPQQCFSMKDAIGSEIFDIGDWLLIQAFYPNGDDVEQVKELLGENIRMIFDNILSYGDLLGLQVHETLLSSMLDSALTDAYFDLLVRTQGKLFSDKVLSDSTLLQKLSNELISDPTGLPEQIVKAIDRYRHRTQMKTFDQMKTEFATAKPIHQ